MSLRLESDETKPVYQSPTTDDKEVRKLTTNLPYDGEH
jgi:hypothetical protein